MNSATIHITGLGSMLSIKYQPNVITIKFENGSTHKLKDCNVHVQEIIKRYMSLGLTRSYEDMVEWLEDVGNISSKLGHVGFAVKGVK